MFVILKKVKYSVNVCVKQFGIFTFMALKHGTKIWWFSYFILPLHPNLIR